MCRRLGMWGSGLEWRGGDRGGGDDGGRGMWAVVVVGVERMAERMVERMAVGVGKMDDMFFVRQINNVAD